jgi:hypothetical protein
MVKFVCRVLLALTDLEILVTCLGESWTPHLNLRIAVSFLKKKQQQRMHKWDSSKFYVGFLHENN